MSRELADLLSQLQTLPEQFHRLLSLLALSPAERAFVSAAAENPTDESTLSAFADWLEEQQRDALAQKMRERAQAARQASETP